MSHVPEFVFWLDCFHNGCFFKKKRCIRKELHTFRESGTLAQWIRQNLISHISGTHSSCFLYYIHLFLLGKKLVCTSTKSQSLVEFFASNSKVQSPSFKKIMMGIERLTADQQYTEGQCRGQSCTSQGRWWRESRRDTSLWRAWGWWHRRRTSFARHFFLCKGLIDFPL